MSVLTTKLYRLLRDKPIGSSEWIRWDPSGKIIMIASETGLVKNILKEHFGQFSIDAFVSCACWILAVATLMI